METRLLLSLLTAILMAFSSASGQESAPGHLKEAAEGWTTDWSKTDIDLNELMSGGPPRDGIPPIDKPAFVSNSEASGWLDGREPVLVYEYGGEARAYPLQILTWHEIVNDTVGGKKVVVSFCPLCNSAMVFSRMIKDEEYTFGTSGLLRNSDLVMWDRQTESLWQQVTGKAVVGKLTGTTLEYLPASLTSFSQFVEQYPQGKVLSKDTGHERPYGKNPYKGYDSKGKQPFLFHEESDPRLDAVARVVSFSLEDQPVAVPLESLSQKSVVHGSVGGSRFVAFHTSGTASALDLEDISESRDVGSTGVFKPSVDGRELNFTITDSGIIDQETGSSWNIFGIATQGKLKGSQLEQIPSGDHFWFAWSVFKPETKIIR